MVVMSTAILHADGVLLSICLPSVCWPSGVSALHLRPHHHHHDNHHYHHGGNHNQRLGIFSFLLTKFNCKCPGTKVAVNLEEWPFISKCGISASSRHSMGKRKVDFNQIWSDIWGNIRVALSIMHCRSAEVANLAISVVDIVPIVLTPCSSASGNAGSELTPYVPPIIHKPKQH